MDWLNPAPRARKPGLIATPASWLVAAVVGLLAFESAQARSVCPDPGTERTPLSELRAGAIAEGESVVVEGVVTGSFMGPDQLGGFYLQQGSGAEATGLFVYAPRQDPIGVGQRLQVQGAFSRHRGRPQVSRLTHLETCGPEALPDPVALRLPDDADRLSEHLDQRVRLAQELTVTANHDLGRYGSLTLAAGGRLIHPNQTGTPGATRHAARQIELDDGSYRANPDPPPYLDEQGTRRVGSRTEDLTGILTQAFGGYRIHPTETVEWSGGERPSQVPEPDAHHLRIATANLENDFVTLGERGARNRAERERQTAKLDALLHALDADLLGAVELENAARARTALVSRLNARQTERGDYAAVAHPAPGDDAIKVGLLYRPDRLRLVAAAADRDAVHHRPPLLGWFETAGSDQRFGAVVVHFKAKSGCPESGDVDRGQGCWNQRRTAQAERLVEWLREQRRGDFADTPVLILGDLNAHAAEDPMRTLRAAGKRDLVHDDPATAYTYVFRGQAGQLDYLLGPEALRARVQGGATWPVNADEPRFLGFDGPAPADGPWRASDHDPVWADLRLD
ncbi:MULTISPECIES: ExeM/NucH family extracellular endonuclease [unclassified Thioalkalivibrio]|uniref:ExeM/NucH family extracellular endonuclease n=1 Tax=unclassified Thioalkalivibrio TaxID=2621013 RepID=UPI00035C6067|nr:MULTISPECIES: ExeM/NucH family extracellular endonuclease [unclassified Thioalkalivibrio]